MKPYKVLSVIVLLLIAGTSQAQLSVNINIGTPPQWGPVGFTDVRYYYLPAVEAYYDIQTTQFIYYSGGVWLHRYNLPTRYRNYDLYNGYKVVMPDYRGDTPYVNFKEHKAKYNRGYRSIPQKTIGERPGRGNSKSNKNHGHRSGKGRKGQ
jgi:hypothetical protein